MEAYRGSVDNWYGEGVNTGIQSHACDQRAFRKVNQGSQIDIVQRYLEVVDQMQSDAKPIHQKMLSLEGSSESSNKNILLSKIYQKSFQLRSQNKGKYRD